MAITEYEYINEMILKAKIPMNCISYCIKGGFSSGEEICVSMEEGNEKAKEKQNMYNSIIVNKWI